MEISICIEIRTKKGLKYVWHVNSMAEYEAIKRKIKASQDKIISSWIEVRDESGSLFEGGCILVDTRNIDRASF